MTASGTRSGWFWKNENLREQVLFSLPGQGAAVNALSFSPDGRFLASGNSDTTVMLWDVAAAQSAGKGAPLSADERKSCWSDLLGDAGQAYRSMWKLVDDAGSIDFLRNQPKAATAPADAAVIDRLIANLDDPQSKTRSEAAQKLLKLGLPAEIALKKALAGTPSIEARRSMEGLLQSLKEDGAQSTGD
jgi:WD40 repeat protein